MRTMLFASLLSLVALTARAQPLNVIRVADLPGTNGNWQMGEVTVVAPPDQVMRWFSDVDRWQARFPDIKSVQKLGRTPDGRQIVRMSSSIIGRPLTLRLRQNPGSIVYTGEGKGVTTQGKIFVEPLPDGHTKVLLQSTSSVHGFAGVFASKNVRRKRAYEKFRSDLSSVVRMSHAWAQAQRRGG